MAVDAQVYLLAAQQPQWKECPFCPRVLVKALGLILIALTWDKCHRSTNFSDLML